MSMFWEILDFENLFGYTEVNIRRSLLIKKSLLAENRAFPLAWNKKVVICLHKIGRIFTFLQNKLRRRRGFARSRKELVGMRFYVTK